MTQGSQNFRSSQGPNRRLLFVSTPVGPLGSGTGGGVELTLHNLVYGLSERGHHIEVIAPAGSLQVGQRVHQVDGALQRSSQLDGRTADIQLASDSVLARMWECAADLAQGHDVIVNFAYDWLPLYLTRFFPIPVVHMISMGSLNDVMDGAIADVGADFPGYLAAHSFAQAATYADPSSFQVVGNGIVAERYDVRPNADGSALGFVGRISREKGIEDIAELSARTGRVVKVWGVLQDRDYWDQILADYPSARLEYQGFLPTDELQAAIGRCAAIVMTPKWVEAFGNVAVEAMATGVPVITYDRGGPAEIVVDGVTGFVVPPDDVDALVRAVDNIAMIDRWKCRQRVDEQYSSLAMADRVGAWLDAVVSSVSGTSRALDGHVAT